MNVKWDLERLSELLRTFVNICGVNIGITDDKNMSCDAGRKVYNDFCTQIQSTEQGRILCKKSDKCLFEKCRNSGKEESHICHAGLVDISAPIVWDGKILGFIILGQIRARREFESVAGRIEALGLDMDLMREYYDKIPIFDYDKIQSILTAAKIYSKYVFMENYLRLETDDVTEAACEFIADNLSRNISIEDIVKGIKTSKATLYKCFNAQCGCTPGEYINKMRTEKSVDMLLYTDCSIEEISERVGFSSASYYSKVFKRLYGVSPIGYRKLHTVR